MVLFRWAAHLYTLIFPEIVFFPINSGKYIVAIIKYEQFVFYFQLKF